MNKYRNPKKLVLVTLFFLGGLFLFACAGAVDSPTNPKDEILPTIENDSADEEKNEMERVGNPTRLRLELTRATSYKETEPSSLGGDDESYVFMLVIDGNIQLAPRGQEVSDRCENAYSSDFETFLFECSTELQYESFTVNRHWIRRSGQLNLDSGESVEITHLLMASGTHEMMSNYILPWVYLQERSINGQRVTIPIHLVISQIYEFDDPTATRMETRFNKIEQGLELRADLMSQLGIKQQYLSEDQLACIDYCVNESDRYSCESKCKPETEMEKKFENFMEKMVRSIGDLAVDVVELLNLTDEDLIGENSIVFTADGYLTGSDFIEFLTGDTESVKQILGCRWTKIEHYPNYGINLGGFNGNGAIYGLHFEHEFPFSRSSDPQNIVITQFPPVAYDKANQGPYQFIVSNTGTADLVICGMNAGYPFILDSGSCTQGLELKPGEECEAMVSFSPPASYEVVERSLDIRTNDTDHSVVSIPLLGFISHPNAGKDSPFSNNDSTYAPLSSCPGGGACCDYSESDTGVCIYCVPPGEWCP